MTTLTRAMVKELVSDGVLVNGIAPAVIATPFHERFASPESRDQLVQGIPLRREDTPEETVGAVLFLASSAAEYLVGEIIEINGGLLMS